MSFNFLDSITKFVTLKNTSNTANVVAVNNVGKAQKVLNVSGLGVPLSFWQ